MDNMVFASAFMRVDKYVNKGIELEWLHSDMVTGGEPVLFTEYESGKKEKIVGHEGYSEVLTTNPNGEKEKEFVTWT